MVAQKFTVDLSKPLVFQVGHLGEDYEEWVHQLIVTKEGPRFFANDFLEMFTRTKWWVIPVVWIPVVCWLMSMSICMGHTVPQVAQMVVGGILLWTLIEYTLHRFLFHMKLQATGQIPYIIFFMDAIISTRWMDYALFSHQLQQLFLVWAPIWSLIRLLTTPTTAPAIFGGGLLGYVMYDCTHYYLHHGQPSKDTARNMKKYHLNHHYRIQNKGFGITSSLWDVVFGTLPPPMPFRKSR
ncbi:dihydroceramide fatty acyl 2-hydroxylase FAH1 isoform X2 [Elaeis guineensis]|uniref:Dihydroceramide fatty acyl 2-hydroxylase FAH1 n=1 Tax=Elaeis guineensis var. tenera TaxID=51953 RepID=A0A6J0PSS2_ELAGV|nr:dihydroceramide fatty acyl 2-hydroxylase FAH1 [Elaeis guineensis]